MKYKWIIGSVVSLVLMVAVYFFFFRKSDSQAQMRNAAMITRVIKVERGDLKVSVSATGTVQPIYKIDVKSKASGTILSLKVNQGDKIHKGDKIVSIDKVDTKAAYDQSLAALQTAQATLEQQKSNFARQTELHNQKLISDADMEAAKVTLATAKANLLSSQASYDQAKIRLDETEITAPIDGLVLDKPVDEGQVIASATGNVSGGTTIITLADMAKVYVEAAVDEVDIGKIRIGMKATIVADAFPDEKFYGKVLRIFPLGVVNQNVTQFTVVIEVENPQLRLLSGMNTTVEIVATDKHNVLIVPTEALKDDKDMQSSGGFAGMSSSGRRSSDSTANNPERAKRREEFAKLSDSEKASRRAAMQENRSRSQDSLIAVKFKTVADSSLVRKRFVMVKDDKGDIIPKMIVIGDSNFDYAEVLDGLAEGDELIISSISRALLQGQQLQQNLRNANGIGGSSSSGGGRGGGR
jgi:HlyD family secretion protein